MRRPQLDSIIVAWAVCIAIVAAGFAILAVLAAGPTPFEEEVIAELATLDEASPSAARVVVIGTSMMANATQFSPTLEERLTTAGQEVTVANIAAPALWFNSYEPLLDHVFDAEPDIIVTHTGVFANPATRADNSLSERVRLLLGQRSQPVRYLAPSCTAGSDLDAIAAELAPLFEQRSKGVRDAERFAERAAQHDVHVYVMSVPRTEQLSESIGAAVAEFDERIFAAMGDAPNVAIAPAIDVRNSSLYCDFNHLNAAGQAEFLTSMVPRLSEFIETVRSGS